MCLETAESTIHQTEDISGAQTKYSLSRYFLGTTQKCLSFLPTVYCSLQIFFPALSQGRELEGAKKER